MAPIADFPRKRGIDKHRGTGRSQSGARSRGRGRGRGRGGMRRGIGEKSTFLSTRVEEINGESSDENIDHDEEVEQTEEDMSDELSSDEEPDASTASVKPYNSLLQSLVVDMLPGQPQRKKRRIELAETAKDVSSSLDADESADVDLPEDSVNPVNEPDEDEHMNLEDIVDTDDELTHKEGQDAFDTHFANPDEAVLAQRIKAAIAEGWSSRKDLLPSGWKCLHLFPHGENTLLETSEAIHDLRGLQLKQKLEAPAGRYLPELTGLNGTLAAAIFGYDDLLLTDRTTDNAQDLRTLTCLHALNHVFKTRDRVLKNNSKAAREPTSEDIEYRDQGFTRPKVLMLLPTRQSCVRAVDMLTSLCEPEQQENRKRFQDSYVQTDDSFSSDKPSDFRELFEGNDDDMFRLGIKFTRKTVKFFSQFYNSDIIIASPLGLKMAIGEEDGRKKDYDFLSSIEVVVVDQADALLMQNWEHVEYIFEHLNLQPKETHGCDFGRVRNWYLDGNAKYLRQTIVLSAYNTPELNRLFNHHMQNVSGKIKCGMAGYDGAILDLAVQLKQTFSRYDAPSPVDDPDARFKYFTTALIPMLTKHPKSASTRNQGILIFIPSYMDFVRVRNFLATSNVTQNISFGAISEYTSVQDVARARSHFFSGRHSVLLYTGRAHHFRRYHLRGVKKVIMYALPDNPIFYKEMVGGYLAASIAEGKVEQGEVTTRSIFSKYDALKLERIVGTKRFATMLKGNGGDTFNFL